MSVSDVLVPNNLTIYAKALTIPSTLPGIPTLSAIATTQYAINWTGAKSFSSGIVLSRINDTVTIELSGFLQTSDNPAILTASGAVVTGFRPSSTVRFSIPITNDLSTTATLVGVLEITTAGDIKLYGGPDVNAGTFATNNKIAIQYTNVTYISI